MTSHRPAAGAIVLLRRRHITWHAQWMKNRKPVLVVVAFLVWAVVTPFMWRDLRGRTAEQVRGPKWLWFIASSNLVTGSCAYWMFGRKSCDSCRTVPGEV